MKECCDGLLNLLSYSIHNHLPINPLPGMVPLIVSWALPYQTSNIKQENFLQICIRANLKEAFSQIRLLFTVNSSLCQDELKTNKQKTKWDSCMKLPQKTLWFVDLHMDSFMQINLLSLTISTVSFCDSHWKLMRNAA